MTIVLVGAACALAAAVFAPLSAAGLRIEEAGPVNHQVRLTSPFNPVTSARLRGTTFSVYQQFALLPGAELAVRDISGAMRAFAIRADTIDDAIEVHLLDAANQTIGDPIRVQVPGLWFASAIGEKRMYLIGMHVDSGADPVSVEVFVGNYTTGQVFSSGVEERTGAFAQDSNSIGVGSLWSADGTHRSDIGMLLFRGHGLTEADFGALVASKKHTAPIYYTGGGFNGQAGVEMAFHHGLRAGTQFGDALSPATALAFDRLTFQRWINTPSGVVVEGQWLHINPFDEYPDLVRTNITESSGVSLPAERIAGNVTPSMRRVLALSPPRGKTRVASVGNSRGVLRVTEVGVPQNFLAGGVAQLDPSRLIGVDLVQPAIGGGEAWPLIDFSGTGAGSPNISQNATLDVSSNLIRWGQNKTLLTMPALGPVLRINAGGHYRTLAKEDGGVTAADELLSSHIYLAYPGSGDAEVAPVASTSQVDPDATVGGADVVALDTQAVAHTIGGADAGGVSGVTLAGVTGLGVEAGWMVFNETQETWTLVSSVSETEGDTVVGFLYTVDAPAVGDTLRFGPWSYVRGSVVNAPDGTNTWRGIKTSRAPSGGAGPVLVIGAGAELAEGEGNIYATFGGNGDGFNVQINRAAPGALAALWQMVNPDVFFVTAATQGSNFNSHALGYINLVRNALPGADVVAAGDVIHMTTATNHNENVNELNNFTGQFVNVAETQGWLGMEAARGEGIGRVIDMVIGGLRYDHVHLSTLGNLRVAQEWQALVQSRSVFADLNGDAKVDGTDLGLMLIWWGPCPAAPADCPADLNGDGVVDGTDLGLLLTAWG